jgi:hypothetical protein
MRINALALDIPETPWDLIARQRHATRRHWNKDYNFEEPIMRIGWGGQVAFNTGAPDGWRPPLSDIPDAKGWWRTRGPTFACSSRRSVMRSSAWNATRTSA